MFASSVDAVKSAENFDREVEALQQWVTSVASTASWDAQVRAQYGNAIRSAGTKLKSQAVSGQITWMEAATRLQQLRNDILQLTRIKTSPVGRALAEHAKKEGPTLNALIGKYTIKKYGSAAVFDALSTAQKNVVYAAIVDSAARSQGATDAAMARVGSISRSVVVLSIAISLYEIATSETPAETAKREGALLGSGVAGGVAGGALAGLACGPGAPVCVTLGAFVGGVAAVLGTSLFWH